MKLHQLEIFACVARHHNITNAACELHMSQPAVSAQLKLLEQEYRTTFYARTSHGVELTEFGRAFLRNVRPILEQIDELELKFKVRARPKSSDCLTVAANNTLSATILPRAIAEFSERNHNVRLVVEVMHSEAIECGILNSEVEVALLTRPSHSARIVYEPYEEHETVAFVPNDSMLRDRVMDLEELTSHPLVVKKRCPCVQALEKRGLNLRLALQCNAREAVKMAVKNGLGIGMLFNSPLDSDITKDDMRIINVPELKEIKHSSFIAYRRRGELSSAAKDFVDTLQSMRTPSVS